LNSEDELSEAYSDYLGPTTDKNNIVVKSRGFKEKYDPDQIGLSKKDL